MKPSALFQERPVRPDQLNEHNQITDKKILKSDRIRFGVGCVMYQSEESGFGPIHTVIVKGVLGGDERHLGWIGSLGSIGSLAQWTGALLLRRFRSNRKAMVAALSGGVLFGSLLVTLLLLAHIAPALKAACLVLYIVFVYGLAGASGIQMNIETSWIGDLVPLNLRGWFTSVKWLTSSVGVLLFSLLFGWIANRSPTLPTYAALFSFIALSHLAAIFLMGGITDRKPQNVNFFRGGEGGGRLNYRSFPLWGYIWFFLAWSGGRASMYAFITAYLLDAGYRLDRIVFILAIQNVISMGMLLIMGRTTDRFGTRRPLIIVSGAVGLSMLLWTASAWWGLAPIIVYQFINGAAGNTHSMLSINYGLEIFPSQGRAGYIGFARILIGVGVMIATVMVGYLMRNIAGWSCTFAGATLNYYHLVFTLCSILTVSSVIPLLLIGKRTVRPL